MNRCPFSNMMDPDTYTQGVPFDELARIRATAPLVKFDDPTYGVPYWLVTRRDALDEISKDPKRFSSAARTALVAEYPQEMVEEIHRKMFINLDPPEHMKYRKIVRRAFTPNAVDSMEPAFREHARRIVDAVLPRGECEFVEEVAAELPLLAILDLLGIPAGDRKDFFHWTNTMIFADDPDMQTTPEEGDLAAAQVIEYAQRLADKHYQNPQASPRVLYDLLEGEVDGEKLDREEFGWLFVLLLVGGNETTRTAIAQGMRLLLEHPDQLQYLAENPDRIEGACEEILRYNSSFIFMRRTAMEDTEVAGIPIAKGDKIALCYQSVNHDERVFGDDADSFDVRRAERMPDLYNQHRSFGVGQHFCLGSHLARMEMEVMMGEVLTRLKNLRPAAPAKRIRSNFISGLKELRVNFDPVAA
jgi:cytochrome P450